MLNLESSSLNSKDPGTKFEKGSFYPNTLETIRDSAAVMETLAYDEKESLHRIIENELAKLDPSKSDDVKVIAELQELNGKIIDSLSQPKKVESSPEMKKRLEQLKEKCKRVNSAEEAMPLIEEVEKAREEMEKNGTHLTDKELYGEFELLRDELIEKISS